MKKLLLLGLLLVACNTGPGSATVPSEPQESPAPLTYAGTVKIYHDDERQVTCWIYENFKYGGLGASSFAGAGGISCLTDYEISKVLP